MFDACVLGVDPGLAKLGLAVVARDGRSATLRWSTTVRTAPGGDEATRLLALASAIRRAIADHRPTSIAVERLAWNRNQVSALQVARATGAAMVVAAEAGLPVEEYGPTEVKIAVTGAGNSGKAQMRIALARVHGFRDIPAQPDAADAVAVALTHLLGGRMRAVARSGPR
jgi:crossover junction endodeoxyribonuclease RuvC